MDDFFKQHTCVILISDPLKCKECHNFINNHMKNLLEYFQNIGLSSLVVDINAHILQHLNKDLTMIEFGTPLLFLIKTSDLFSRNVLEDIELLFYRWIKVDTYYVFIDKNFNSQDIKKWINSIKVINSSSLQIK